MDKILAKFEWKNTDKGTSGECVLRQIGHTASSHVTAKPGERLPSFVAEAVKFMFVHAKDVESVLTLDDYEISFVFMPKPTLSKV